MEIDKAIVYAEREGFRALELDVYRGDATPPREPRSSSTSTVAGGG